ncbi:hypothetical protein BDV32DRAFT_148859 [Aspergillus pseudonomiae]|uniref:Uncharacterized protein n=1 Tax=Aspergillus pseudonomiae TaxID=1506151 RepID=A0A5N6I3L1_9EURO|nr:uncharacterized protein BDV37DRAFT_282356 [Aspergillus pseudonomiae]KAB8260988.1 hypothetical protein BDV32DRAFT_148859 [Aspergillus pseudonomiae]KAE8404820.1 hypothetical protein BDV37DRAFT_282356 [Aspergillus pseudonomiae]
MPITWTPEADAKLLLGFVDQFKDANFKPDYNKLAAHMGPDVTACAVLNHIIRLRRMVAKEDGHAAASTPAASPSKSKSTTPKGKAKTGGVVKSPSKVAKRVIKRECDSEDEEDDKMAVQVVINVKKEEKDEK